MNKPLSRQYLLDRGSCCNNKCINCPYPNDPSYFYRVEFYSGKNKHHLGYTDWVLEKVTSYPFLFSYNQLGKYDRVLIYAVPREVGKDFRVFEHLMKIIMKED